MRNFNPAVRQKLAILLKARDKAKGGDSLPDAGSNKTAPGGILPHPNLAPPNPTNGLTAPKDETGKQLFSSNQSIFQPKFFNIKKKVFGL